jgi:hypothetical protein
VTSSLVSPPVAPLFSCSVPERPLDQRL